MQRQAAAISVFPLVVVSMMELAARKLMTEDGSRPTQVVCIVRIGAMGMLDTLPFARLGQRLATVLERNYPARLHRLYVLDLPTSALWLAQFVQRWVHPVTKRKVVMCASDSPEVPRSFEKVRGVGAARAAVAAPTPAGAPLRPPRRSLAQRLPGLRTIKEAGPRIDVAPGDGADDSNLAAADNALLVSPAGGSGCAPAHFAAPVD